MNKRILGLILFSLSFLTPAPAQAWHWSDFVPSWFKSRSAVNAQPVINQRNDIEAQHIVPVASPARSWYSSILSNPLSGAYASFSAWWGNNSKMQKAASEALKDAAINTLKQRVFNENQLKKDRSQLFAGIKAMDEDYYLLAKQKKAIEHELAEIKKELNALKSPDANFEQRYKDLQAREKALMSALVKAENEKILSEHEKQKSEVQATLALSKLRRKEADEAATKAALEQQVRLATETSQAVDAITQEAQANNHALLKLMQEMSDFNQKENAQSQARVQELQMQLQKTEQEKERLTNDQRNYLQQNYTVLEKLSAKLALLEKARQEKDEQEVQEEVAILQKEAKESDQKLAPHNPMLNSGDFLRIENEPAKSELGQETYNDYKIADDIVNPALISDDVKNEYMRVSKLAEGMPSWNFVKDQIKLGALWAYRIATDQKSEIQKLEKSSQSDHLNTINAINWLWYAHALKRTHGYVEGTNTIEDFDDSRFYNVMFKYAQKVNSKLTGTLTDPKRHLTLNAFADSRESSHFKESQKKYRHYGIDARYGEKAYAKQEFPAGKRHLLFGKIDENKKLFFTKPENYGLYLYDGVLSGEDGVGGHTLEFLVAQARKWMEGADDQVHYRKERIPATFIKPFTQIIQNSALSSEVKAKLIEQAQKQGFQTLTALPEEANTIAALSEFKSTLEKEYGTLENRWGRENRITRHDIYSSFNPKYLQQ